MPAKHTSPPHLNSDELANKLATENSGLVTYAIKVWFHSSQWQDDLRGYGALGLVKASRRFNPSYGFKFSTYAVPIIRREIMDGLRTIMFSIRIPDSAMHAVWNKEDKEQVPDAIRAMKISPIMESAVAKTKQSHYYDEFCDVHKAMSVVPPRLRRIIEQRHGIGCDPMKMREIAKKEKCTKQRIGQLLVKGYRYISRYYEERNLDPYDRDEKVVFACNRTSKERLANMHHDDGYDTSNYFLGFDENQ